MWASGGDSLRQVCARAGGERQQARPLRCTACVQAELERRYQEELRWQKKEAEHYRTEWEAAKAKRKELEEALAAVKADMARQLKEALADAEVRAALALLSSAQGRWDEGVPAPSVPRTAQARVPPAGGAHARRRARRPHRAGHGPA